MSLLSMTGYGRGEVVSKGVKIEVELSSVNRKQLDIRIGLPTFMSALDARIKKLIASSISRGAVSGTIKVTRIESSCKESSVIDIDLARNTLRKLRKAASMLDVEDDIALSHIMKMPDVIKNLEVSKEQDVSWQIIHKALNLALTKLLEMRKAEGKELQKDICSRIDCLKKHVEIIRNRVPISEKRLKTRVRKSLREAGLDVRALDDRVQKEIIFYIDKANISEEIVRLDSHFKHFAQKMKDKEPVGRSLDFLCQEMFREINTIGSKSNDEYISKRVVLFKTELESIREQVQNIE